MRRSTFYTDRTRTWSWAKSRCSWKAETRRPPAPVPTNPVYDGTRPTPPYAIVCKASPREPSWCPVLPPATHAPRGWANPDLPPPLSRTRGAHQQGQVLWQERPGTPLLLLVVTTRGDPERDLEITPTHLCGAAPVPRPPPPGARGAGRGTHLPANTGGHRRYGSPPSAAPPGTTRRPPGAQGPEPCPRLGAVARRVGRVAPPPPLPMPMDGHRAPAHTGLTPQPAPKPLSPPPPPEHCTALPTARH